MAAEKNLQERIVLDTKLWEAVKDNNLEVAKMAFDEGACPDLFSCYHRSNNPEYGDIVRFKDYLDPSKLPKMGAHGTDMSNSKMFIDCSKMFIDSRQESTLMMATRRNNLEMVEWLIDVGKCNVNAAQPYDKNYGFGGLTAICCAPTLECVKLLLSKGADPNSTFNYPQYEDGITDRSLLLEQWRCGLNFPKRHIKESEEIARCLIRHGADVNAYSHVSPPLGQDTYKNSLSIDSYWASVIIQGTDLNWCLELLEKYNADPNFVPGYVNDYDEGCYNDYDCTPRGATILILAVLHGHFPFVKALLEHGADPNLPEVWPGEGEPQDDEEEEESDSDSELDEDWKRYKEEEEKRKEAVKGYYDEDGILVENRLATPLSVALALERKEMVSLLREKGAKEPHADTAGIPATPSCLRFLPFTRASPRDSTRKKTTTSLKRKYTRIFQTAEVVKNLRKKRKRRRKRD
jgi:ankyrin repeat protein